MKLTAAQIAQIEQTLVLNGLKYDDIKLEVTDHIASEIEAIINKDGFSFEKAFAEVFEKWKPQLRPTSYSLWLGRKYSGPKIIMDKLALYTKSRLLYIFLGSVPLTLITMGLIHSLNPEIMINLFAKVIRILFLSEVILVAMGWILIWRSKKKTTFGYLFKKRSVLVFFQPLLIGIGVFPLKLLQNSLDIQIAFTYFLFALFLFFMIDFSLVFNHVKIVRKLSIV